MTFGFIAAEKARFPISRMCDVLGVSQSGFFAWQDRPACRCQQQDMVYLAHIRTAFALSNGTYGGPRMHRDLVDEGHQIGRHRTARLMRENQLIARPRRRFKRTTDSEHAWPVAPNLVARDFQRILLRRHGSSRSVPERLSDFAMPGPEYVPGSGPREASATGPGGACCGRRRKGSR